MDLSTTYLGLKLSHPFMPGASPLVDDLDVVKRLEDAGASAIVMHSLFEEQIAREQVAAFLHTDLHGESHAEALTTSRTRPLRPGTERGATGPRQGRRGTIIASSTGPPWAAGWSAKAMERGGRRPGLNVWRCPRTWVSGQQLEDRSVRCCGREASRDPGDGSSP
jgi:dihydroorotate dehydrogenase (fumarate)